MSLAKDHQGSATSSRKAPVYQVLAEDIRALGIEAAFGLMSDDTALLATALDGTGVRFYGARHENTAITMAEGYAYAAGRIGVAVVGRGPALANGLHGAVYASRTGSPVLLIYGEAATGARPNGLGPSSDWRGRGRTGTRARQWFARCCLCEPDRLAGSFDLWGSRDRR